MFQETHRDFQEMARENRERREELDRLSRETDKKFQETDRRFKETDEKFKETDRMFHEKNSDLIEAARIVRENAIQMQETDRRMQETDRHLQETDRHLQETDRIVKEVSRQLGGLGSRWGEFVEGMVAPACETLFAKRGIPVHKVGRRMEAKLPGNRHMEIDILVVNTDAVVLVEVKSRLTEDDVREHIARLSEFKEFFREYGDKRVMGAVAGIVVEESVGRYAANAGLFVMVQAGETMQFANSPDFFPRIW
ncbi:MAG: hypothetical protein HQL57_10500 [Magnetococcales bacterium]|nr:hypothetical protein [Magnetococcales bacterium]MBF0157602.1 hypothetical protein [Magnetococcales bacterium]